ncbi:HIT-like domain-containing protein [Hygrophoropsis aurantiaca]|uniref:HIT-like domain-containing protein n=1 Tax=Hygrophoropsis aurantiaca TaxID=72124 RepID=A0ACB8A5B0_9AGAM|nr:HIT-like domain-containing protein [Hygrophoropsis aurantiaca]
MAAITMPINAVDLQLFEFERVLDENPAAHNMVVLGTLPSTATPLQQSPSSSPSVQPPGSRLHAILRIEKTVLPSPTNINTDAGADHTTASTQKSLPFKFAHTHLIEHNDIYSLHFASLVYDSDPNSTSYLQNQSLDLPPAVNTDILKSTVNPIPPDVKISVIFPATDIHIRKYTRQEIAMVRETPSLYTQVVRPYIETLPEAHSQWISDIISGKSEAEAVLYPSAEFPAFPSSSSLPPYGSSTTPPATSPNSVTPFILLPDLKWDRRTPSTLYLLVIACDPALRSLRDLRGEHVGMLVQMRTVVRWVVAMRWGLGRRKGAGERGVDEDRWQGGSSALKMYIHYQPSYYRFHVHVVPASSSPAAAARDSVGGAWLLDDVIELLKLDPNMFQRLTLTYGLGTEHALYIGLIEGGADEEMVHVRNTRDNGDPSRAKERADSRKHQT